MKAKVLFVTHEGCSTAIFRSQVLEHCESLKAKGCEADILTYEMFSSCWSASLAQLSQYNTCSPISIVLKRAMLLYWPGALLINSVLLLRDLINLTKHHQYNAVHARSDYTAFLCIILRPFHRLPVIWDCRGDIPGELNLALSRSGNPLLAIPTLLLVLYTQVQRFFVAHLCDDCITVSSALSELIKGYCSLLDPLVIPCPVPSNRFYFSSSTRISFRNSLNITNTQQLVIYSGSMNGYQAIPSFLWYYKTLLAKPNVVVIVATPDLAQAQTIFYPLTGYSNLRIMKFTYDEMSKLYCAADYAVLHRDKLLLNWVSSPTKFGEYCLSGLPVIHNSTIDQVIDVTAHLQNGYPMQPSLPDRLSDNARAKIAFNALKYYSRSSYDQLYLELYDKIIT